MSPDATGSSPGRELLSIIVPVYNEVGTIRAVIDRLQAIDLPVAREILVVNDGSRDGTREELDRAVRDGVALDVLQADRNRGKGSAIRRGLEHARGTIVAIQDADLELDPQQLSALVAPLVTFAANRALTGVTNLLFGASLTDMETCYKIMRTDVARSLKLSADRFDIEPEITARLLRGGHRIHELPVRFEPRSRAQGKKIGWRDGLHALQVLIKERTR